MIAIFIIIGILYEPEGYPSQPTTLFLPSKQYFLIHNRKGSLDFRNTNTLVIPLAGKHREEK